MKQTLKLWMLAAILTISAQGDRSAVMRLFYDKN